jgi:formamidopyrimidine-DNA glycosylase
MPELPDVTVYVEVLQSRIAGSRLRRVDVHGPFLLRSVTPSLESAFEKPVVAVRRVGKRIAIGVEGDVWLVIHLMIAGRLHWQAASAATAAKAKLGVKNLLAAFVFDTGVLSLTEAGSQRRASLHVVSGEAGLTALHAGGLDVLNASTEAFAAVLKSANHTLKRALTDPRLFDGIGNAYSDEILHRACLSPVAMTLKLQPEEIARLQGATREVLLEWIGKLRAEAGSGFPEKVTAFRDGMAVHGRYGEACPRCGEKVQRIRYASNETGYCPRCQTGGKLLADRALSRLLREDWPRTPEELENLKRR